VDNPLYWCVNGTVRCNVAEDIENTTYREDRDIETGVRSSVLRVPASIHYNGSGFRCCFFSQGEKHCSGPPANLFVPGKFHTIALGSK